MRVATTQVKNILTRTSGYLKEVSSHSVQPYRGCSFGRSLCGVGCYVQHNQFLLRGEEWGTFLDARTNAAESYLASHERERTWARRSRGKFTLFFSSSTDPFVPHEARFGVTRSLLDAMTLAPPDAMILQTHSHTVVHELPRITKLAQRCDLRVHLSIESDRDRLPGLPPPASSVKDRLDAALALKQAGIRVIVTVSPLFPIDDPDQFFAAIRDRADGVVLDHYIGGDGSVDGHRTARTSLPAAMATIDPTSLTVDYLDRMIKVAQKHLTNVGVHRDGFAGIFLPPPGDAAR